MIKINLLPSEFVKKEERREIMIIAYIIAVIVLLFLAGNYGVKYMAYKEVENQIKLVEQDLARYETIVRQVEELQNSKTVLETRKSVIDTLMQVRLTYPKFMEDLLSVLTEGVWLKTCYTKSDPAGALDLNISAESLDNYAIADFLDALYINKDFSNVELGAINTQISDKGSLSSFTMKLKHKKANKT
jgi:Tfp pilus assembly protein PilN